MKPVSKLFQSFSSAKLAVLLCSSLLVSCGGGTQTAGIGGTGISYGAVTDFGSIILNGSDIDDIGATAILDDNPGVLVLDDGLHGGLKRGMVVKVSGDFSGNTGTASTIEYRDNLEGEVCDAPASVDGIRILRVLGQTVILDATTIVDNTASIDTIIASDIVEVSGLPDDQDRIHASFIEVKTSATEIEVKGRVDAVSGSTLTINALDVDFSGIGVVDSSIPGGVLVVDQFIEVKGTSFTCGTPDTLIATKIELEPEGAGAIPDGVNAEVEGFVTNIGLMPDSFMIGNRKVDITGSVSYLPDNFSVNDIVVGTKIEAEGTSTNGVLTATKISFRENVKFESTVDTGNNSSFTLVGLPGIIITTNSATDDIGVTVIPGVSHIRVRGIEGPNNTVLATQIDDQSGTDVFMQGPVDDISGAVITILGVPVDTNDIPENLPGPDPGFQDTNENGVSRTTFLGLVQPGTLVKFGADLSNGVPIIWDEAELEDD